jgi:YgiT-type zinc finger domain-containing protein
MIQCEECRVGRYQERQAPYTAWLETQMVVVPDVPALVCDICGDIVYDAGYVRQLQAMIEDRASRGRSSGRARRRVLAVNAEPGQRLRRSR